jgi:L,D-transpeptidase YbiS
MTSIKLKVDIPAQKLFVFHDDRLQKEYSVSTGKNGAGEMFGSEQTPRGLHVIRAKIGANYPANTVFVGRRPTGEIFTPELREKFPDRDWILTRIFWLSGMEPGKNRLGQVDTMRRYIYIHGTPNDVEMGVPGSRGCVRMRNEEIIELFEEVPVGAQIFIYNNS